MTEKRQLSSEQQDSAATCKAVVVDCPGIGKMKWCEQCAIYFGKDQPCPSSKEKQQLSDTPRMDATLGKGSDWVFAQGCKLERELAMTDKLLTERERVLRAIPGCPFHGDQCVPHALEWIAAQSARPKIESWMQAHHADHKFTSLCDGCKAIQSALAATDKTASDKGQG